VSSLTEVVELPC